MIKIRNLTLKNFLSIGNVTQSINFEDSGILLVLGRNIDIGDDGARNGVGKTAALNALSYGLFGLPLNNIRKDNLINKTNQRHMMVTVEFDVGENKYRIERGRRPTILRLIVNNIETSTESDEGQGEMRLTQAEINKILGLNHVMFKHLIALNTYTEPFLSLRANDQRDIIEHLLGITLLSEKATVLKDQLKETKDSIKEEEYNIKAIENANKQIESTIGDLERRQTIWYVNNKKENQKIKNEIKILEDFNLEKELALHNNLEKYLGHKEISITLNEAFVILQQQLKKEERKKVLAKKELDSSLDFKCYVCNQSIKDEKHEEIMDEKISIIEDCEQAIETHNAAKEEITAELELMGDIGEEPVTRYKTVSDTYEHQNRLETLHSKIEALERAENPYIDQINDLQKNGLKKIEWYTINDLQKLKEHQDFLLKLLTNKDSFVRKRIIEQNLQYLNSRLNYYLIELGLPHEVYFQNDLSVEITELGRELDFDNLSRGERTRLILGLSWSFRDVFENMNQPIDFLAVDEILDNGLDLMGLESSIRVLKNMQRNRNKNIFLVSHKEELVGRVSNVLYVQKENGFTSFTT